MEETRHVVQVEISDGVAMVRVARQEALNALNAEVIAELANTFRELRDHPDAEVIILTGAGDKAFVAGADIKAMIDMSPLQARRFAEEGQRLMLAIEGVGKPTIAAVNGYALGGGLELALACSFIYASENARLGLPEVTIGVLPAFGGTQNLPRVVGAARARELVATGRMLTAHEAMEWGLVNAVFPAERLLSAAQETAQRIRKNGREAVACALEAVNRAQSLDKESGLQLERALFGLLFSSPEQRRRMTEFTQRSSKTGH